MQPNAFLRNGSSIFEGGTVGPEIELYRGDSGYQTSYVFHLENPVRFTQEIKATMNSATPTTSPTRSTSVAYWYSVAYGGGKRAASPAGSTCPCGATMPGDG